MRYLRSCPVQFFFCHLFCPVLSPLSGLLLFGLRYPVPFCTLFTFTKSILFLFLFTFNSYRLSFSISKLRLSPRAAPQFEQRTPRSLNALLGRTFPFPAFNKFYLENFLSFLTLCSPRKGSCFEEKKLILLVLVC